MANLLERSLQEQAQSALSHSGVAALRDLRVDIADERLVISGLVSLYYHKQLAQETVRRVADDVEDKFEVVNAIEVR